MANMSYCRFENTVNDLRDCLGEVTEANEEAKTMEVFLKALSSEHERRAFKEMYDLCQEFVEHFDDLKEAK